MPAQVCKTLQSVKVLDEDGMPVVEGLDATVGKFMTRMHANNAKQSALSATGGKYLEKPHVPNAKNGLERPHTESNDRVSKMPEIIAVDPSTVWQSTLGKTSGTKKTCEVY